MGFKVKVASELWANAKNADPGSHIYMEGMKLRIALLIVELAHLILFGGLISQILSLLMLIEICLVAQIFVLNLDVIHLLL